jgi:hypothetical protein
MGSPPTIFHYSNPLINEVSSRVVVTDGKSTTLGLELFFFRGGASEKSENSKKGRFFYIVLVTTNYEEI